MWDYRHYVAKKEKYQKTGLFGKKALVTNKSEKLLQAILGKQNFAENILHLHRNRISDFWKIFSLYFLDQGADHSPSVSDVRKRTPLHTGFIFNLLLRNTPVLFTNPLEARPGNSPAGRSPGGSIEGSMQWNILLQKHNDIFSWLKNRETPAERDMPRGFRSIGPGYAGTAPVFHTQGTPENPVVPAMKAAEHTVYDLVLRQYLLGNGLPPFSKKVRQNKLSGTREAAFEAVARKRNAPEAGPGIRRPLGITHPPGGPDEHRAVYSQTNAAGLPVPFVHRPEKTQEKADRRQKPGWRSIQAGWPGRSAVHLSYLLRAKGIGTLLQGTDTAGFSAHRAGNPPEAFSAPGLRILQTRGAHPLPGKDGEDGHSRYFPPDKSAAFRSRPGVTPVQREKRRENVYGAFSGQDRGFLPLLYRNAGNPYLRYGNRIFGSAWNNSRTYVPERKEDRRSRSIHDKTDILRGYVQPVITGNARSFAESYRRAAGSGGSSGKSAGVNKNIWDSRHVYGGGLGPAVLREVPHYRESWPEKRTAMPLRDTVSVYYGGNPARRRETGFPATLFRSGSWRMDGYGPGEGNGEKNRSVSATAGIFSAEGRGRAFPYPYRKDGRPRSRIGPPYAYNGIFPAVSYPAQREGAPLQEPADGFYGRRREYTRDTGGSGYFYPQSGIILAYSRRREDVSGTGREKYIRERPEAEYPQQRGGPIPQRNGRIPALWENLYPYRRNRDSGGSAMGSISARPGRNAGPQHEMLHAGVIPLPFVKEDRGRIRLFDGAITQKPPERVLHKNSAINGTIRTCIRSMPALYDTVSSGPYRSMVESGRYGAVRHSIPAQDYRDGILEPVNPHSIPVRMDDILFRRTSILPYGRYSGAGAAYGKPAGERGQMPQKAGREKPVPIPAETAEERKYPVYFHSPTAGVEKSGEWIRRLWSRIIPVLQLYKLPLAGRARQGGLSLAGERQARSSGISEKSGRPADRPERAGNVLPVLLNRTDGGTVAGKEAGQGKIIPLQYRTDTRRESFYSRTAGVEKSGEWIRHLWSRIAPVLQLQKLPLAGRLWQGGLFAAGGMSPTGERRARSGGISGKSEKPVDRLERAGNVPLLLLSRFDGVRLGKEAGQGKIIPLQYRTDTRRESFYSRTAGVEKSGEWIRGLWSRIIPVLQPNKLPLAGRPRQGGLSPAGERQARSGRISGKSGKPADRPERVGNVPLLLLSRFDGVRLGKEAGQGKIIPLQYRTDTRRESFYSRTVGVGKSGEWIRRLWSRIAPVLQLHRAPLTGRPWQRGLPPKEGLPPTGERQARSGGISMKSEKSMDRPERAGNVSLLLLNRFDGVAAAKAAGDRKIFLPQGQPNSGGEPFAVAAGDGSSAGRAGREVERYHSAVSRWYTVIKKSATDFLRSRELIKAVRTDINITTLRNVQNRNPLPHTLRGGEPLPQPAVSVKFPAVPEEGKAGWGTFFKRMEDGTERRGFLHQTLVARQTRQGSFQHRGRETEENGLRLQNVSGGNVHNTYYKSMPELQLLKRPETQQPDKTVNLGPAPSMEMPETTVHTKIASRNALKQGTNGAPAVNLESVMENLLASSNINRLAEKVYRQFERKLKLEKMRRGI